MTHPDRDVILVGVSGAVASRVLLHAAGLARDLHCELVCAHVDENAYAQAGDDGSIHVVAIDPDLLDSGDASTEAAVFQRVAAVLDPAGVSWTSRTLAGEPARALGRLADELGARMIVVGTRETGLRSGLREFFGGSIAVHLAHRQHHPVLVVPLSPVTDDGALPWE